MTKCRFKKWQFCKLIFCSKGRSFFRKEISLFPIHLSLNTSSTNMEQRELKYILQQKNCRATKKLQILFTDQWQDFSQKKRGREKDWAKERKKKWGKWIKGRWIGWGGRRKDRTFVFIKKLKPKKKQYLMNYTKNKNIQAIMPSSFLPWAISWVIHILDFYQVDWFYQLAYI